MSHNDFYFRPSVFNNILSRRDSKFDVLETMCDQLVDVEGLDYKLCNITKKNYLNNKGKVISCIKNCSDAMCPVQCIYSNSGLDLEAYITSPNVKAEIECKQLTGFFSCLSRCNIVSNISCIRNCKVQTEPGTFSCLSEKINVSKDRLEKREACVEKECLKGNDLSNFQACFNECTTGKKERKVGKSLNQTEVKQFKNDGLKLVDYLNQDV